MIDLGPYSVDTIVTGDCLEVMRQMPDGCVDLVVTDPPYFQPATHYQTRSVSTRSVGDLSILETWFGLAFSAIVRILANDGFLYCFCDGQSYPLLFSVLYDKVKAVRPLIWDKIVSFSGYTWRHQHELILFAEGHGSPSIPTGDGDVLKYRAVPMKERKHLAQKPLALVERLVRKHDGLVFDPFIGSGTTAIAAKQLGRHYFGCDINPEYVKITEQRLKAIQKHLPNCEICIRENTE